MKTFIKYPGGKSKELPLVEKYLPKNVDRYFEPFVGGGAVYFGLEIKNSYINDFSKDLINLYLKLQKSDKKLLKVLNDFNKLWEKTGASKLGETDLPEYMDYGKYLKFFKSANDKKTRTLNKFASNGVDISSEDKEKIKITANKTSIYMLIRDLYNNITDETLRLAAYYFMREYCYSSMFRFSKTGAFNVPYGGMSYNDKTLSEKVKYMFSPKFNELLLTTVIHNSDFEQFLKQYSFKETDFIFLDPPYDSDFSTYDQNSFDKKEQIRLKNAVASLKAKWMLIIKKTDFISELYKDFFVYEYDKNYTVSFKNRNEKGVKHLLITNYDINEVNG